LKTFLCRDYSCCSSSPATKPDGSKHLPNFSGSLTHSLLSKKKQNNSFGGSDSLLVYRIGLSIIKLGEQQ
jgi:hypothetical protein